MMKTGNDEHAWFYRPDDLEGLDPAAAARVRVCMAWRTLLEVTRHGGQGAYATWARAKARQAHEVSGARDEISYVLFTSDLAPDVEQLAVVCFVLRVKLEESNRAASLRRWAAQS